MQGWNTGHRYRRTLAGAPARPAQKRVRARSMTTIKKAAAPDGVRLAAPVKTGVPNPCPAFFAGRRESNG
ncbi:hypothetical protein SAMN02982919_02000 [Giesbergeria anulus]|uniref:Uncharacterized protein n=1 Tax=Giesbergeria anulus TaxID=180197 RepID=A0A1H9MG65_9BURK|nr:hypothetical protein SAMN02982919_02000 [Giesbergeria anulus]